MTLTACTALVMQIPYCRYPPPPPPPPPDVMICPTTRLSLQSNAFTAGLWPTVALITGYIDTDWSQPLLTELHQPEESRSVGKYTDNSISVSVRPHCDTSNCDIGVKLLPNCMFIKVLSICSYLCAHRFFLVLSFAIPWNEVFHVVIFPSSKPSPNIQVTSEFHPKIAHKNVIYLLCVSFSQSTRSI